MLGQFELLPLYIWGVYAAWGGYFLYFFMHPFGFLTFIYRVHRITQSVLNLFRLGKWSHVLIGRILTLSTLEGIFVPKPTLSLSMQIF